MTTTAQTTVLIRELAATVLRTGSSCLEYVPAGSSTTLRLGCSTTVSPTHFRGRGFVSHNLSTLLVHVATS